MHEISAIFPSSVSMVRRVADTKIRLKNTMPDKDATRILLAHSKLVHDNVYKNKNLESVCDHYVAHGMFTKMAKFTKRLSALQIKRILTLHKKSLKLDACTIKCYSKALARTWDWAVKKHKYASSGVRLPPCVKTLSVLGMWNSSKNEIQLRTWHRTTKRGFPAFSFRTPRIANIRFSRCGLCRKRQPR